MPEAIVPKNDAVDRVVDMFRHKLQSAVDNGQRIRMDARDHGSTRKVIPERVFERASFAELLTQVEPDGGWELHVYIEPKR